MFTPVETSIGALLLHQATSILLHNNGGILGISGYMRRLMSKPTAGIIAMFAGMAASFPILRFVLPEMLTVYPPLPSTPAQAFFTFATSLLIGWGTKAANGCTSGHMLCGLSRLSGRSALAVAVFFPTALITHHLANPPLRTSACPGKIPCYTATYPSLMTTTSLVALAAIMTLAGRTIPQLVANSNQHNTNPKQAASSPTLNARLATEFLAGLEFGLGLHITQMANPVKVSSFLNFPILHMWDPSMALVILFGIVPSLLENVNKGFSKPPRFAANYELPTKTLADADWRLTSGAAVFGIGWGLSGTCPGPALLRAVAQPAWGLLWMAGFWAGGVLDSL